MLTLVDVVILSYRRPSFVNPLFYSRGVRHVALNLTVVLRQLQHARLQEHVPLNLRALSKGLLRPCIMITSIRYTGYQLRLSTGFKPHSSSPDENWFLYRHVIR